MTAIPARQSPLPRVAKLLVVAAWAALGSAAAHPSFAEQPVATPLAGVQVAELERSFWTCEYAATTPGQAGSDIARCTAVYEALKERKFGGDFEKLLEWWRSNKAARYNALAAAAEARSPR